MNRGRILAYALGSLLIACGPAPAAALPGDRVVESAAEGLVLRLAVPQREFLVGERVEAALELRNNRPTPITLVVAAPGPFDLVVYDAKGTAVWTWTARPLPLVPPARRMLAPGGTIAGTVSWDQMIQRAPQPPGAAAQGTYFIEGILHAPVLGASPVRLRTPLLAIVIQP